jgi:hypothetical protein
LKDQDIDGRIIFKWILKKKVGEGADNIDMPQNRDKRCAFVNTVMNLGVV